MQIPDSTAMPGVQETGGNSGNIRHPDEVAQDFAQALEKSLREVDGRLKYASQAQQDVAAGGNTSVHEAMVAGQKANLSMRLALQVRNKAMEAYQEIMRMQV